MKFTILSVAVTLLATVNAQRSTRSGPAPLVNNRICDYQSNGYFFSTLRTHGPDARAYCAGIGAELVDVDNYNFAGLTQMIVKCLGPGQKAWVNSWDGNTFANSPLAIFTGLQSGSGSININLQKEPLFAICSDRSYRGDYDYPLDTNYVPTPSAASSAGSSAATGVSSAIGKIASAIGPVAGSNPFALNNQALDFDMDEYALPGVQPIHLSEQELSDADEEALVESLYNAAIDKVMETSNMHMDANSNFVPKEINVQATNNGIQSNNSPQMFGGPFPGLTNVNH